MVTGGHADPKTSAFPISTWLPCRQEDTKYFLEELMIKTTVKCHIIPPGLAVVKRRIIGVDRDGEKLDPS